MSLYQLASVPLGGVSTVTISGFSSSMNHLMLHVSARSSVASVDAVMRFRFNGDTNANYPRLNRQINKTQTSGYITGTDSTLTYGGDISIPGASGLVSTYSHTQIDIFDYNDTNKYTHFNCESVNEQNSVGIVNYLAGMWKSTALVTSITIFESTGANFVSGSTAYLYGYGA